jgi:hypothetical protein
MQFSLHPKLKEAISNERPMVKEQATLSMHIMKFHGYIGFINLTFIDIHKL